MHFCIKIQMKYNIFKRYRLIKPKFDIYLVCRSPNAIHKKLLIVFELKISGENVDEIDQKTHLRPIQYKCEKLSFLQKWCFGVNPTKLCFS
jgi:hypothetical protein